MPPNSRQSLTSPIVKTNPAAIVTLHPEMNIPRENLKSSATVASRESEIVVDIEESVSASGESTMESGPSDAGVAASGSSGSGKVPERRSSSEIKQKLHGNQLMSSVQAADSWGHHTPAALPFDVPPVERNDSDLSDPDEHELASPSFPAAQCNQTAGIDTNETLAAPPTHRSQSWCPDSAAAAASPSNPPPPQDDESDNVANYINMSKLFRTSSSDYAYSKENAKSRKVLEKMATKTTSKRVARRKSDVEYILDDSSRSKESVLTLRSSASAYRGPEPRLKNGRRIPSVLKKRGSMYSNGGSSSHGSAEDLLSKTHGSSGTDSGNDNHNDNHNDGSNLGKPITKASRNISFSSVDIREHERIAGDNPCVSQGVPLSIGWGYYQHDSIDLDDYENGKGPARDKVEMMVPTAVRRSMLRQEFGVSIKEMNEAMKQANITKRQRRHTVATEHLEGWSEVLQSAKRKFKRIVKGTTTEKEMQKLWEKAHKSAMGDYLKAKGEGSLGKNPEEVGAGEKNVGPLIAADGTNPPFSEIVFDNTKSR